MRFYDKSQNKNIPLIRNNVKGESFKEDRTFQRKKRCLFCVIQFVQSKMRQRMGQLF